MSSTPFLVRMLAWRPVWLVAALLALAVAGCGGPERQAPRAAGGVIDLRDWNPARDGVTQLDGEWDLLWNTFDDPAGLGSAQARRGQPVTVPGPWNDVQADGAPVGANGHASYRLVVDCYQAGGLALSLPMQHSALRLYVNGRAVAQQGSPGATAAMARPAPEQQIVPLDNLTCPLHIVAHVSNFDTRRGGLMRSMGIGAQQQIHQQRERGLARDLFALGCLMVMSVLPLLFFLWRRSDRSPLYFGLFGLSFALCVAMTGERILQPVVAPLGFAVYFKLVFLSLYMNITLFTLFLRALYPREITLAGVRVVAVWGFGSALLLLALPLSVFGLMVPLLQLGSALVGVYMVVSLVRALRAGHASAGVLLAGLAVLIAAITHDSLNIAHLRSLALAPWGMVLFVLAPGILLAQRFARALSAEELRALEQRERANLLVRATRAGTLDWDAVAGSLGYSARFREMLGYPETGGLPPFYDMVHAEDRDGVRNLFMTHLRRRDVRGAVRPFASLEYRLLCADGQPLWVHAEGIGLCGADGRTLRFICSFIDISQRKRQEIELSNRVKFTNDLIDSLPLALALRDPGGRYLVVNRTWEHYIGLNRESVIGTSLRDVADPAAGLTLALDAEALALGPGAATQPVDYDYQGRRYMQTRTVMMDAQGQRIGVLVASLDITEKYVTEQALAVERERLRLLVRSTRAGFGDWDAERNTVTYTGRFREMLGYPADADTSQWPSIFDMMHPDDRERARAQFRDMIRRKPESGEQEPGAPMSYRLRRTDGSYIWIHAEGISQVNEQGRTQRFITSYLDVTAFREQEEALRVSRDQIAAQAAQLEQQNETLKDNVRLREEVERIGRHDIKTPLNSIIAVPRLLREERALSPEEDELLGVVERAGYRILSMVNLSLDLYKMENGSYIFRPDAVDLGALLDKVLADLRSHAASKGVALRVVAPQPVHAWAEELLCYSLLANLVKNALEASPEGATVTMTLTADGAGQAVTLQIHNQGAVPDAVRGQFFEKYATAGKASGTGLGTYSARLMARVQDGDIGMQTSDAQGTTLTVRLRAAPEGTQPATVRHAATAAPQQWQWPALQVLLVDDDEYNLLIVRRFLPSPPFTVATAINGRMALDMAQAAWPDVIIMDLDMPVMGGLEAVGRLRTHEQAAGLARCHIIALSSHDDQDTQRRCLAAGFDLYLTKPVTRDVIHATLARLTGAQGGSVVEPTPDPDLAPLMAGFVASRRVLVNEMTQAIAQGERETVRRIAHQLAGSFSLYGFHEAAQTSRALEAGAPQAPPDELAALADRLRVLF